uniref:UDP-N-acetyl-D-mannosamine dehydrogenase n=1 Tax=Candidatus Methanophaga sp. ANME-1 ERB7 TaxID=2759913 RepID=A0A7G9ZAJ5_9EURY|nr:UDP-N-acetyl-D-mannosamine dehydrogenase [Methanosarcinales archaeon ANME-1 ERB7]
MKNKTVCIVGLGYVGLPLAEAFSRHLKVIGYDIDDKKIRELNAENDKENIEFTSDPSKIKQADFVLICVPTPVTKSKEPDLKYVKSAAEIVGKNLKKGVIVVLESTIYPGVTEEIIAPILDLERESGLKCGADFKIGYSPERINPGDEAHTLDKITKIVAGMDEETTEILAELYGLITNVYKAKDIRTAEAAKVIENIQRDLNIALMNELAIIFHKMSLDTKSVLEAASTKWNFHLYKPGLVGGHCIPVDPYYLVYKAKELDYHPQVILAGRAINDYKLFCTQKPLLNCLRYFCFAKTNISLVKLSFQKKGLR